MLDCLEELECIVMSATNDNERVIILRAIQVKIDHLENSIKLKLSKCNLEEELEVFKRGYIRQQQEINNLKLLVEELSD